jgi:hypothetical protein
MSRSRIAATIVAAIAITNGAVTAAQSLADVARQDAARRGHGERGRTYTNADLATEPRPAPLAPPPASSQSPAIPSLPSSSSSATRSEADAVTAARDMPADDYWRTQAQALSARVEEARGRIAALERRLNDLEREPTSAARAREQALTQRTLDGARRDLKSVADARQNLEQLSKRRTAAGRGYTVGR